MASCALAQALICQLLAMPSSIEITAGLVAGLAIFATISGPARNALAPDLVPAQYLLRANAVLRGATAIGRMAGWLLGGYLTGTLGNRAALLSNAVSFVLPAAGARQFSSAPRYEAPGPPPAPTPPWTRTPRQRPGPPESTSVTTDNICAQVACNWASSSPSSASSCSSLLCHASAVDTTRL